MTSNMFGGANDSRSNFLDSEAKIKIPAVPEIIHIIIQVIIYCVGLNFQIRTILVCIKEKNKTWQIHIAHSVVMSVFFGYLIPFRALTHFVPSLATHVGSWICYISAFVEYFGYHAIVIQSLLIAGVKYLFIVHTLKNCSTHHVSIACASILAQKTLILVGTYQILLCGRCFFFE